MADRGKGPWGKGGEWKTEEAWGRRYFLPSPGDVPLTTFYSPAMTPHPPYTTYYSPAIYPLRSRPPLATYPIRAYYLPPCLLIRVYLLPGAYPLVILFVAFVKAVTCCIPIPWEIHAGASLAMVR